MGTTKTANCSNGRRHVRRLKLVFRSCGAKGILHFRELRGSNNKLWLESVWKSLSLRCDGAGGRELSRKLCRQCPKNQRNATSRFRRGCHREDEGGHVTGGAALRAAGLGFVVLRLGFVILGLGFAVLRSRRRDEGTCSYRLLGLQVANMSVAFKKCISIEQETKRGIHNGSVKSHGQ